MDTNDKLYFPAQVRAVGSSERRDSLSEMRPSLAMNDVVDSAVTDTVKPFQFSLGANACAVKPTNLLHLFVGQLCCRTSHALRRLTPAFVEHIVGIIGFCASKQVAGIDATAHVATMKGKLAVAQRAIMQFVAKAMSNSLSLPVIKLPIAILERRSYPEPASRSESRVDWATLVDLLPKTLRGRTLEARVADAGTVSIDESKRLAFDPLISGAIKESELGLFATTAVAITVGNFLRGIVRGMLLHVNSPFATLTTPADDLTRRAGNFIGCYLANYSTDGLAWGKGKI